MAEKMSTLVLKVDFECSKCYNKVRRTLCSYHYEIRSQTNDTKQGTITITGPFDASSFAKKLNSKAGKAIKGIEIKKKEEDKPKEKPPAAAEKPKEKQADKPKEGKPKSADAKADKPKEDKPAQKAGGGGEKPKKGGEEGGGGKQDPPKQAAAAAAAPPAAEGVKGGAEPGPQMKMIEPGTVLAYPIVQPPPYGAYSVPCYEGYVGGGPVYDGYCGRTVSSSYEGYGYGDNRGYGNGYNGNYNHGNYGYDQGYSGNNGGTEYFSEKNPACIIM